MRLTNIPVREKYQLNLDIPSNNQVTFGRKTLTFFGPKTWNSLLYHIKSAENPTSFKTMITSFKTMISFRTEKPVAVKFVVKIIFFPIRLA